ncbi:hypothetical protein [Mycobacterium malmoense]|uniref:hypothetical protein n=1 Tax=Mycobacterium malmoense TaxID=1780 RepID=UPI001146741C|nr:hypothetical protein [Mycobacterium malmoense]
MVNAIRTHVNNHTLEGWVKAEKLAEYTGLKVRGVRKQIAANVKAGWLEIVQSGNSSGLANTYRLSYPKGVLQDMVPQTKGVPGDTVRVSSRTEKGVLQDTPTTPITTPENFSIKRSLKGTTPDNGVPQDTLATDPFGSGDLVPVDLDRRSTDRRSATEFNGVPQDTLASWDVDPFDPRELEHPGDSGDPRDPFSAAYVPPVRRALLH